MDTDTVDNLAPISVTGGEVVLEFGHGDICLELDPPKEEEVRPP